MSEVSLVLFQEYIVENFGTVCEENIVYRTSGVIFFIDYCTAPRDT
jgi:hypothetical protein